MAPHVHRIAKAIRYRARACFRSGRIILSLILNASQFLLAPKPVSLRYSGAFRLIVVKFISYNAFRRDFE